MLRPRVVVDNIDSYAGAENDDGVESDGGEDVTSYFADPRSFARREEDMILVALASRPST